MNRRAHPTPQGPPAATDDPVSTEPVDFVDEPADEGARYYRAADDRVELRAGFYLRGGLYDAHVLTCEPAPA